MLQTSALAGKGSDFLWLSRAQGVVRIDPDTGVGLTLVPNVRGALAVTDDAVWVGGYDGQLYRVNVATNKVDATYEFPAQMTYLATGFGSLWAASESIDLVVRLDIVP
jgi:hypothetical protein